MKNQVHQYIFDTGETWDTPNKTLNQFYGDCEEFSTTFLSIIKSYRNSLKCFNLVVPSHLTTICKFNNGQYDYFYFYDQGDTAVTGNLYNAVTRSEMRDKMRNMVYGYFNTYYLDGSGGFYASAAFNETDVHTFDSDVEFYDWLIDV